MFLQRKNQINGKIFLILLCNKTIYIKGDKMIYFTKDNCPYTLTSKYNEKIENGVDYSFYNIKAIDLENNIIGELDYRLDLNNKHARLLFIEITNPKYVKQGVGHSLITQFENEISERKTQIFVTGSSSLDLVGGIQESAVGRLRRFYLWPFSVNELVRQYGTVETARMLPTRMIYGMYPAVVESKDDPRQILEDYCEGIVFKDIFSLTGIRKAKQFMDLVQMLAYRIGSEINYDSLARECGLSKHAVSDYIDLLEQCFIVKRCDSFAKNLDNELKKGKKVYLVYFII